MREWTASRPGPSRRAFAAGAAALAGVSAVEACAPGPAVGPGAALPPQAPWSEAEYIVIGSGAGGGPLAANLARAGHRVLLLEAGGGHDGPSYSVPAFHPLATEDPALSWAYYVRHYADQAQQARDAKFVARENGVFYPRAGTLGGCTAHHAMITIGADAADWDSIADLTKDPSWRAENMQSYFQRLERCRYRSRVGALFSRHGFSGWLTTAVNDPLLLARDHQLREVVFAALDAVGLPALLGPLVNADLDPNDWHAERDGRFGIYNIPVSIRDGRRSGVREYVLETADAYPGRLQIRTHALASRILFEGSRAVGAEYLEGPHLYRADPRSQQGGRPPARRQLRATREVILAAGAFNSPQLLKLSGIGPREELARFGIGCRVDLPGVGSNLQDRYEMSVVTRMRSAFPLLEQCTFRPADAQHLDPCYAEWLRDDGPYETNGTVLALFLKSSPGRSHSDLILFGIPGRFEGYFPGYSEAIRDKDFFTWAILKAHTRNTAGTVRLRSADPRDPPDINFHYFSEGNDAVGEDLASVVAGVAAARGLTGSLFRHGGPAVQEAFPGPAVTSSEDVARFVADQAWGHHASCSNRMGPAEDPMSVVDSRFRVHRTSGLRVVDASVFPRIPGFFIATPIYVISEKASDTILEDVSKSVSNDTG